MLIHRPAGERGHADHGWLITWHTFSFNLYNDPEWIQWGPLRVINEDIIAPGQGFPTHPHRDMEIITYVISGALAHRDSTGSTSVIRPGLVQHMTAGSGITHSEYNALDTDTTHLLQIWIHPRQAGLAPSYTEAELGLPEPGAGLRLLADAAGSGGVLRVQQDARMYDALLRARESVALPGGEGRRGWLQLISGGGDCAGLSLEQGDGLGYADEGQLEFRAATDTHLVCFDLG